jgi:hypothetical protein
VVASQHLDVRQDMNGRQFKDSAAIVGSGIVIGYQNSASSSKLCLKKNVVIREAIATRPV